MSDGVIFSFHLDCDSPAMDDLCFETVIESLFSEFELVCSASHHEKIRWLGGSESGQVVFEEPDNSASEIFQLASNWARVQNSAALLQKLPVRISIHRGPVKVSDATIHHKLVSGKGLRFSRGLTSHGKPDRVLVSKPFRDWAGKLLEQGLVAGFDFGFQDERAVYVQNGSINLTYSLVILDELIQRNDLPQETVHAELMSLVESRKFWDVIYLAKRLLQSNSLDDGAMRALESINPNELLMVESDGTHSVPNPLLGQLSDDSFVRFITTAQLVERMDGEPICTKEDSGDTMFIVLRGEIGVILETAGGLNTPEGPCTLQDVRYRAGKNVGELALALKRSRTASMQAVGRTALLAIDYESLSEMMVNAAVNDPIVESFRKFLLGRVLEHVCRTMPYLSSGTSGPLGNSVRPWERLVAGSRLITLSWQDKISSLDELFRPPGIYILASGRLIENSLPQGIPHSDIAAKRLDGHDFPIIYADLPQRFVNVQHDYRFDSSTNSTSITIVHIHDDRLRNFGPKFYEQIVDAVRAQYCRQSQIDAFISYNQYNQGVAKNWFGALTQRGLKVYMSQPEAMKKFKVEIECALREALVMIPFVSSEALGTAGRESWVEREIKFRKNLFDENQCNILPVEITKNVAEKLADGFSSVAIGEDEESAIDEVFQMIQRVRTGLKPPPYSLLRTRPTV